MSQNKTVIQGLEPDFNRQNPEPTNSSYNNFYSRGTNRAAAKGTVVPGMMDFEQEATSTRPQQEPQPTQQRHTPSGKPVVGFLYSISKTPTGEFWPLSIGPNTIGKAADSAVVLSEGTVSSNHAVLVIRQIKSTGNVIAAITDSQSTNGTLINGDTIGFTPVECHNGDIITVGNNYELVLILIDTAKLGLTVSKDFIPTTPPAVPEPEDEMSDFPNFNPGNSTRIESPYGGGTSGYTPGERGTVGMDGSVSGNNHGGTIPM